MTEKNFDREKFVSLIGSEITAQTEGSDALALSLTEVSELKDGKNYESFSVLFLAPENYEAGQGLYEMHHETLDPMALFLVPVGVVGGRVQLEAVFNFAK